MTGVFEEMSVFCYAIRTGAVLCGIYILIKILRIIFPHKNMWISIQDFLFWIYASVSVFLAMLEACHGVIRWYYYLGIVLGAIAVYSIWYMTKKVIYIIKKRLEKKE